MTDKVCAVVVTHRRPDDLAKSLDALSTQTRMVDHLIVVDNDNDERSVIWSPDNPCRRRISDHAETSVAQVVSRWACCMHSRSAPPTGYGWPTTTGGPRTPPFWPPCWTAPRDINSPRCHRWSATSTTPDRLAFPLRRGLVWRRHVSELGDDDLLPGIASLFNGALFRASTLESVGVPDIRLFIRGDEVDMHRRLVLSGLPFGTCLKATYLHPPGQ